MSLSKNKNLFELLGIQNAVKKLFTDFKKSKTNSNSIN